MRRPTASSSYATPCEPYTHMLDSYAVRARVLKPIPP